MKTLTPKQLQEEAERLIKSGKMPTLEELCAAVLESRRKYRLQILRARREAREEVVPQVVVQ
jgi:hypothetical protein